MSANNWLTEIISSTKKIFVCDDNSQLALVIKERILNTPDLQLVSELEDWQVVIYVIGKGEGDAQEISTHAHQVHQLGVHAVKTNAQMIMVSSSFKSTLARACKKAVEQLHKNLGLSYSLIETGKVSNPHSSAEQIVDFIRHPETPPKKTKSRSIKSVLLAMGLVLAPWLILASLLLGVFSSVVCIDKALEWGRWSWMVGCAKTLRTTSRYARIFSDLAFTPQLDHSLIVASKGSEVILQTDKVAAALLPYARNLFSSPATISAYDGVEVVNQTRLLTEQVTDFQAQLSKDDKRWPVDSLRRLTAKLAALAADLPQLLAFSGHKTWLILIQDHTELRPSGGFVESIGLIEIENGRITSARFLPTAQADAQLAGQVTPPLDFQQATGQSRWYLRESNWEVDFAQVAHRAAWFVEKELERPVDGVVALTTASLGSFLQFTGPVTLAGETRPVTQQNWLASYHSSLKLNPQTEFITQWTQALYDDLPALTTAQWGGLLRSGLAQLEGRQIFIYPLTFEAKSLATVGWNGQVSNPECSSLYPCVKDYVYLVDANVGVNKADSVLNRQLSFKTEVDSQKVTTTYHLNYIHTGVDSGWPMGEYKNYARLLLSARSQLTSLSVNGVTLPVSSLNQRVVGELVEVGFPMSVSAGQTTQVEVRWEQAVPSGARWTYQLQLLNQPGVKPYPVQGLVRYPATWWSQSAFSTQVAQVAEAGQISYNSLIDRPSLFQIDLVPDQ